ncbi:hypothetical protein MAMO4S_01169 [Mesorhizobium amorphae]
MFSFSRREGFPAGGWRIGPESLKESGLKIPQAVFVTDWLEILKQETATGERMGREVPDMLAHPDISAEQVQALFSALDKQADFAEKLAQALEKFGHDFPVITAAERLEERYADLAAIVADKLKEMRK